MCVVPLDSSPLPSYYPSADVEIEAVEVVELEGIDSTSTQPSCIPSL